MPSPMPASRLLAAALLVSLAAACGGKSPSSPSSADPGNGSPAPAPSAGSATIGGQVVSQASAMSASMALTGLAGVTVRVTGTSLSALADGNGRFSLSNVPSGDQQLEFTGHGASARITLEKIAEREKIDVTVAVTGGSAELVEEERVNGSEAQLEGLIASLDADARTLQVRGVTVQVPTGVPIRHGAQDVAFSDLRLSDRVHVKGTKNGTSITASEIDVQQGVNTPGGGGQVDNATVKGAVSKLAGSCPDRTFSVGGKKIIVTASTEYQAGASCGALTNGATVEVEGPASGSTIIARSLRLDDETGGNAETTLRGAISARTGTCPSLTFTLQGKTVTTGSSTDFRKGTCKQAVDGTTVEAVGLLTGNTLAATKVQFEK